MIHDFNDILHFELYSELYKVTFNTNIMTWDDGTISNHMDTGLYVLHRLSRTINKVYE